MSVIPALWVAEVGGLLEARSLRPSLTNRMRLCLYKKEKISQVVVHTCGPSYSGG